MYRNQSITLVLPCYNEAQGLRELWPRIPSLVDEVVVVDNNSTDGSGAVAESLGARVVTERRQGYGAAYKAGFAAATKDVIVAMDADGTYPVEQTPQLVDKLLDDGVDFISGCRFPVMDEDAMPKLNRLGNWGLTFAAAALFRAPVRDSQSGMWVFRRAILDDVQPRADSMAFSQEIKFRVIAAGYKFSEVHIQYGVRVGEVKLDRLRDGVGNLVELSRLWWELRREEPRQYA